MKLNTQCIALAEFMGWKDIKQMSNGQGGVKLVGVLPPLRAFMDIPDYPGDLHVLHFVEGKLDKAQQVEYLNMLNDLMRTKLGIVELDCFNMSDLVWAVHHATALEKAEAILKALNLWVDDKS